MQHPAPDHSDWVVEEGEAFLATNPDLATSIDRQVAADKAGTLKTVDSATVRRMLEQRAPEHRPKP